MAFQQPARQTLQRAIHAANEQRDDATSRQPAPTPGVHQHQRQHHNQQQTPDELQAWVLFSPADNATTTPSSYLSEGDESLQTPGRSRASDFGSLDTNARRSGSAALSHQPALLPVSSVAEDVVAEDDGELDSLDSHLPDFRTTPEYGDGATGPSFSMPVLPAHDGLGSFRVQRAGDDANIQEQLYAFERFNPRRRSAREGSGVVEIHKGQLHHEEVQQSEKMARIETWRLEQSRILLEEIQKETRRRRQSQASAAPVPSRVSEAASAAAAYVAKSTSTETAEIPRDEGGDAMDWHEDEPNVGAGTSAGGESEGLLSRLTRTVIKELIGIDDNMLSILFGEALPEEETEVAAAAASPAVGQALVTHSDYSWQVRLLERVARELGLFVNRLSHHPGAFSTYARMQHAPIPYAGLPAIPEAPAPVVQEDTVPATTTAQSEDGGLSPVVPEFQPTVLQHPPLANLPGTRDQADHRAGIAMAGNDGFSQEEWERDLDIKLVFKYLRSRFSSSSSASPASTAPAPAKPSPQDSAAKAARVRQHHPLLSTNMSSAATTAGRPHHRPGGERRSFKATTPASPVKAATAAAAAALRRAPSCASQSTRRSAARRSSCSSRHYWDIGGSLGTGSVVAPNGPMGSWGDV